MLCIQQHIVMTFVIVSDIAASVMFCTVILLLFPVTTSLQLCARTT